MKKILFLSAFFLFSQLQFSPAVFSEVLTFKNGQKLQAQILRSTKGKVLFAIDAKHIDQVNGLPYKEYLFSLVKDSFENSKQLYEYLKKEFKGDFIFGEEWVVLSEHVNMMRSWNPDNFLNEQYLISKNDVLDIVRDNNQVVITILKYESGRIKRSQYFFYREFNSPLKYLTTKTFFIPFADDFPVLKLFQDDDRDGLSLLEENCEYLEYYHDFVGDNCQKMDPHLKDTDFDGWWDSFEFILETDPTDPESIPFQ